MNLPFFLEQWPWLLVGLVLHLPFAVIAALLAKRIDHIWWLWSPAALLLGAPVLVLLLGIVALWHLRWAR